MSNSSPRWQRCIWARSYRHLNTCAACVEYNDACLGQSRAGGLLRYWLYRAIKFDDLLSGHKPRYLAPDPGAIRVWPATQARHDSRPQSSMLRGEGGGAVTGPGGRLVIAKKGSIRQPAVKIRVELKHVGWGAASLHTQVRGGGGDRLRLPRSRSVVRP